MRSMTPWTFLAGLLRCNPFCGPLRPLRFAEGEPRFCITLFDPVCAAGVKTYGNGCEAGAAGVTESTPGKGRVTYTLPYTAHRQFSPAAAVILSATACFFHEPAQHTSTGVEALPCPPITHHRRLQWRRRRRRPMGKVSLPSLLLPFC